MSPTRAAVPIGDKRVLTLAKAFLSAGVLSEHGVRRDTTTGTPQGGILMAESIIGLYKRQVITMHEPRRSVEDVELATLRWLHWWNATRLHSGIGNVAPAEYEAASSYLPLK